MYRRPLFRINIHFLSAVLLSGFQSSSGALKSIKCSSTWFHGFGGHSNCNFLIEPFFTDLGHGIHRSRAWQFLLIFNTVGAVYKFYSTFDSIESSHDDVIKRKHFPRYWPFVRRIHRSPPGEFPAQRLVTWSLMFSLICAWINGWVNNGEAGDLRRHHAHYDVIAIKSYLPHPSMVCNPAHQRFCWWCHYIRDH